MRWIALDELHLIIKSDQYTFFTKLINGKFPDFTRIIPKETSYNLSLPKAMMIDAIKKVTERVQTTEHRTQTEEKRIFNV